MSPFDFLLTFYSKYGSISCPFWDIECRRMSWPWNPGQRSLKVIESGTIRYTGYGFLLVFYSNFVPKMHCFSDIWLVSIPWPPNSGSGSLKVMEHDIIRSGTHDFLLTFYNNHGPISHCFRDKQQFQSKITIFFPPQYILCPRWRGSTLNWVSAQGVKKLEWLGLPDSQKSFKIGLVV